MSRPRAPGLFGGMFLRCAKGLMVGGNRVVLATGSVIDRAYAEYTSNSNLGTIPNDDTIPQVGEGTEVLSVSITPKSTTNRVRVRFMGFGSNTTAPADLIAALFVNGGANAVRAACETVSTGDFRTFIALEYEHVPGAITAQTYSLRAGSNTGTARLNGHSTTRFFGGAAAATLVAEEIVA